MADSVSRDPYGDPAIQWMVRAAMAFTSLLLSRYGMRFDSAELDALLNQRRGTDTRGYLRLISGGLMVFWAVVTCFSAGVMFVLSAAGDLIHGASGRHVGAYAGAVLVSIAVSGLFVAIAYWYLALAEIRPRFWAFLLVQIPTALIVASSLF